MFDEDRNNGKIGELNDTNWKYGNGGARLRFAEGSTVEARVFFDNEDFFQNTFAVPAATPPRSQSNLSLEKTVPTNAFGSMVQWSRPFQFGSRSHVLSAGTDFRWIDGDSDELTFALPTGMTPLIHRIAGGTQRFVGVFVQDLIEMTPKLQLTLSARLDSWRNYDAHNLETDDRDRAADACASRVAGRQIRYDRQPATWPRSIARPIASRSGAASARVSARQRSRSSTARSASARC